ERGADQQGGGADEAAAPGIGHPAAQHDADCTGRSGGHRQQGDLAPREAALDSQEAVVEQRRRRHVEVGQEARHAEQRKPPAVARPTTTRSAPEKARATSGETASHDNDGTSAPSAPATQPPTMLTRIMRRRPRRSAAAMSKRASTPPARTTLPAKPWLASLE